MIAGTVDADQFYPYSSALPTQVSVALGTVEKKNNNNNNTRPYHSVEKFLAENASVENEGKGQL